MNYAFLTGLLISAGGAAPPVGDIYFDDILLLQEMYTPDDLSSNNYSIEIRGRDSLGTLGQQVRPDTSKFKFGTQSMKCHEGSEGFVAGPRGSAFAFSNADWTVEFWMAANSEPSVTGYWYGSWQTLSNKRHMRIGYNPTTNVVFVEISIDGTGTGIVTGSFDCDTDGVSVATLFDGNFHHIAVSRNTTNIDVYVDGIRGGTRGGISTNNVFVNSSASDYNVVIGASNNINVDNRPDNGINCWIDEFRLTLGLSRYSGTSFTPPTAVFGRNVTDDPDFANTELLMDFEGEWGPRFYSNEAGVQSSVSMNDTSQDQWINNLFFPDANTIGFAYGDSAANVFGLGSGDFTIEVFGFKGTVTAGRTMVANYHPSDGRRGWRMRTGGSSNSCAFEYSTDGLAGTVVAETCGDLTPFIGTANLDSATAYDLCVERHGSNLNFYVNGVLVETDTITATIFTPTLANNNYLGIGRSVHSGGSADGLSAEVRAVRVTKGVARYATTSYTVPTLPLPKSA